MNWKKIGLFVLLFFVGFIFFLVLNGLYYLALFPLVFIPYIILLYLIIKQYRRGLLLFLLLLVIGNILFVGGAYLLDPFNSPKINNPFFVTMNCGETRYKFEVTINSKEDFINFLKEKDGFNWEWKYDNYRLNPKDRYSEMDWNRVYENINVKNNLLYTIYNLEYNPSGCGGFNLQMSNKGHVSLYGCCGI